MADQDALILIVDDTPANLDLLSQILRGQGYRVRAAPSGAMALDSLHLSPPDLVLLDIKMPEMDGYQVCQILKADAALQEIPVIFISALDDAWDKVKAFQVGGTDYLTKPFQAEEVLARVAHQIQLRRMRQALLEHARELEEANLKLLEVDKLKQSFASMLVHDLRSPLQCVSLILNLQRDGAEISDDILRMAESAVADMTVLLTDLLDVFRSTGAELPMEARVVEPGEPVRQAVQAHTLMAAQKAIRMEVELSEGLPTFHADPRLVKRALGNLLGNALKYTPSGGRVRVMADVRHGAELEQGRRWLVIRVEDTGRGIPPEVLPFVFDPFWQTAKGDASLGVGLGLAIVQRIMAAHRGRATVQSHVGQGSAFGLWFPLEA